MPATLPAGLRPLALAQPKVVCAALVAAAAKTMKGFGRHKLKAEFRYTGASPACDAMLSPVPDGRVPTVTR